MSSPEKVIPLVPTSAFRRRMMMNHAVPGLALLLLGVEALTGGGEAHVASGWLNIAAGGAVIVAIARELRKKSSGGHSLVAWVDILAGCVIIVEGVNHFHPNKGFQPAYLAWLTGVLTILLGIFHQKVSAVRRITLGEKAFSFRTRLLRRSFVSWNAVDSIQARGNGLEFQIKEGKRRSLSLRNVENARQIRDAFHDEAASRGIGFVGQEKEGGRVAADAVRGNS